MQTPLSLFHRPEREWRKRAHLLRNLGNMREKFLFINYRGQITTVRSIGCCKQTPGKEHFLRPHCAKCIRSVLVIFERDAITERPGDGYAKTGGGSSVAEIADGGNHEASADGVSMNGRNRRFGGAIQT